MTTKSPSTTEHLTGILPINKSLNTLSFDLIRFSRKATKIKKIGHAGTLDPFATGVMILLVGKEYTKLSDQFLNLDKEYYANVRLGATTDSFDLTGKILTQSKIVPSPIAVEQALEKFQGLIDQVPPMFSAKKVGGKKLYELARKGISLERKACKVHVKTTLIEYNYPDIELHITCSKGTYIRSIAADLGELLGCGAHLTSLTRLRCGPFHLSDCLSQEDIFDADITAYLRKEIAST